MGEEFSTLSRSVEPHAHGHAAIVVSAKIPYPRREFPPFSTASEMPVFRVRWGQKTQARGSDRITPAFLTRRDGMRNVLAANGSWGGALHYREKRLRVDSHIYPTPRQNSTAANQASGSCTYSAKDLC